MGPEDVSECGVSTSFWDTERSYVLNNCVLQPWILLYSPLRLARHLLAIRLFRQLRIAHASKRSKNLIQALPSPYVQL